MSTRINLRHVTSLVVDSDQFTRNLVVQMLRGFGMPPSAVASTGADAKHHMQHHCPDLCIIEAVLPDMDAGELLRWIRRLQGPVRFVPTIVLTGYTQVRMVSAARDGGAHIVAKKPISPKALFDRILWLARVPRPFIEAGEYVGPDRRFQNVDPPDGAFKRDTDAADKAAPSQNPTRLSAAQQMT